MKDQMHEMFLQLLLLRDMALDQRDQASADVLSAAAEVLSLGLTDEGKAA